jgi:hypothetical protein
MPNCGDGNAYIMSICLSIHSTSASASAVLINFLPWLAFFTAYLIFTCICLHHASGQTFYAKHLPERYCTTFLPFSVFRSEDFCRNTSNVLVSVSGRVRHAQGQRLDRSDQRSKGESERTKRKGESPPESPPWFLRFQPLNLVYILKLSEVGGSLLRHKMVNVDGRWEVCRITRNREKRR